MVKKKKKKERIRIFAKYLDENLLKIILFVLFC